MSKAMDLALRARDASPAVAALSGKAKDAVLRELSRGLLEAAPALLEANLRDVERAKAAGSTAALVDRLRLDEKRIAEVARGVDEIRELPDPVGEVVNGSVRPDGLVVHQERVPLGVVLVIFESRPNVVIDIAALAIKSGNAAILRGGKEALDSNVALGKVVAKALRSGGLPETAVQVLDDPDRELMFGLLERHDCIDIVVPRGGESLIRTVRERSRIPVVAHDKGVCHIFVDASAKKDLVEKVVVNAKAQRPGTCNAVENVLIHRDYPHKAELLAALRGAGVEIRVDGALAGLHPEAKAATEEDWDAEYLDLILSLKQVEGLDEAVAFIRRHGSGHSEAILTESYENQRAFMNRVDAAAVLVNASTRLVDGGVLGLGAEVGISTAKLHVRGPMGVRDLTCLKYKIYGNGHVRT